MNAIVAANSDWGIGLGGAQPVVIPEDRRRFRLLTDGGIVIAGRKTYEHLPGPLPNRKNIVLTRDRAFVADGAVVANSPDDVLSEIAASDPDTVFVIGGGDIYRLFLPLCTCAFVTKIDIKSPSDVFFPDLGSLPGWSLVRREFGITGETRCGLPDYAAPQDGKDGSIRYTFDLYKNNVVEEKHV